MRLREWQLRCIQDRRRVALHQHSEGFDQTVWNSSRTSASKMRLKRVLKRAIHCFFFLRSQKRRDRIADLWSHVGRDVPAGQTDKNAENHEAQNFPGPVRQRK